VSREFTYWYLKKICTASWCLHTWDDISPGVGQGIFNCIRLKHITVEHTVDSCGTSLYGGV